MIILFLCNKDYYDRKMSRVRFQSMHAISKVSNLTYSGLGWDGYDSSKGVQENIDILYKGQLPDLVVAYKPLELKEFKAVKCCKCMTYNEMWDTKWTTKEILESGANIVICHHLNDIPKYNHIHGVKFVNLSHCAEKTIYRDYGEPKINDVLFVGATGRHYPFRTRLLSLINNRMSRIAKCKVLPHAGGDLLHPQGLILEEYAKEINRSKITITCSSAYRYRLGKYAEIPMCASMLAADLPDEAHDFFNKFMLVLNPKWSDDQIIEKIMKYVRDDDGRNERIRVGLELNREYTQEKYAERFLKIMEDFLGRSFVESEPEMI